MDDKRKGFQFLPVSKDIVLWIAFTSGALRNRIPLNKWPAMKAAEWKATTSNKIVTPKGDLTDSMLIARGAPTHRAVTNTDSGGKNGRIALQTRGKNL